MNDPDADEVVRLAAQMIDWLQGYEVPNPLEQLGGAIAQYRRTHPPEATT